MSAERQLNTVVSMNVTMPHMGHISKAIEAESSPSPRGPNSSKSVKPFDGREPEGTRVHKIDGPPGKPRRTETKKRGGSPVKRPQAQKNRKAENGKGPNIQTATTSTGYLGCLHREESHRTAPNTLRKTKTDRWTERTREGN